jgi:hypothetical protein
MNSYSKPLILADDTGVLIIAKNFEDLKMRHAPVLNGVGKCSLETVLSLNIHKTNVMKLIHLQDDPVQPLYIDNKNLKSNKYKISLFVELISNWSGTSLLSR